MELEKGLYLLKVEPGNCTLVSSNSFNSYFRNRTLTLHTVIVNKIEYTSLLSFVSLEYVPQVKALYFFLWATLEWLNYLFISAECPFENWAEYELGVNNILLQINFDL